MNVILSLAVLCLALNNGMGAPTTARYMFVKCNPHDTDANCQTYHSPVVQVTSDLPTRLPVSAAPYLKATPVEEEDRPIEGKEEKTSWFHLEEGSGILEGSAVEPSFVDDRIFATVEPEPGSGAALTYYDMIGLLQGMQGDEARPPALDLREDNLLQL
ncbi:serglycin [Lampris incognitus]|uniref:serglycin n=1 Tax=Lampris incognitus TaxID=2546036 RepID=UPI0024B5400A|nr:serglycin [Lampris incognitus]